MWSSTGDVEQGALVDRALARGHFLDDVALFVDDAARHAEPEHAERVADAAQHLDLGGQFARIAAAAAHEDVERFLDAQQVFLDRRRHGAEQVLVASGHRALRVLQLDVGRQQRVEPVDADDLAAARPAHAGPVGGGMRDVVQQVLGQFARRRALESGVAVGGVAVDLSIDAAEQQLDRDAGLEAAVAHRLHRSGGDPPETARRFGMRDAAQAIEDVDQAVQVLARLLVAEPLQQRGLESEAQAKRLRAALGRRRRLLGAGSGGRQADREVGREQRRFAEQALAAAGAQVVQQRQQDDRDVLVAALQALEIVGQLHHAAHQHRIRFVALAHRADDERFGEALHVLDHHRRAVQLDHAQGALHLMQVHHAVAHRREALGRLDVLLERLARLSHGRVERRLDPVQCGEITVVMQFHRAVPHGSSTRGHATASVAAACGLRPDAIGIITSRLIREV